MENSVWIGTGDGNLIMFDVIASIPGCNPDGLMVTEPEVAIEVRQHVKVYEACNTKMHLLISSLLLVGGGPNDPSIGVISKEGSTRRSFF